MEKMITMNEDNDHSLSKRCKRIHTRRIVLAIQYCDTVGRVAGRAFGM